MTRAERHAAWESLLAEPIAAVAEVRVEDSRNKRAGFIRRGTAVLTETRLLVVGSRSLSRISRNPGNLKHLVAASFPRSNVTECTGDESSDGIVAIRYLDDTEHKIRIRPGRNAAALLALLALLEQDIDGT